MRKYTEQEFNDAVATSTSIRQVLSKLGIKQAGGNYKSISNYIVNLNLDISHFTGQGWNKGKQQSPKRELNEYLSGKVSIQSYKLKNRLLRDGIFESKCYKCELSVWLGQPISLELEHINGNHSDNALSNLTLLCPNCHAQTSTYRGKNKKKA